MPHTPPNTADALSLLFCVWPTQLLCIVLTHPPLPQVHDLTAENALLRDAERSLQARCRNLAGETSIRRTRQASLRGGSGARRRSESAERRQAARAGGQISPFHTSRGKLNSPLKASGDSTSRGRQRTSPATAQSSSGAGALACVGGCGCVCVSVSIGVYRCLFVCRCACGSMPVYASAAVSVYLWLLCL